MNAAHLEFCASAEWRELVEDTVLPAALRDRDLGTDVIEIGPGPGFTTDVLREGARRVTAVEIDPVLARPLGERLGGTNVNVVLGDGTALSFPAHRFTGAGSFNMLHHVPTADAQDRIFSEFARALLPGGLLVAADAVPHSGYDAFHDGDTYNPIDPESLGPRLTMAGFSDVDVDLYELGWTCVARTPA